MANWFRPAKLGLALGGGGARGLAHIGVLKALEAAGVQVDYLAGSSMGGLLAVLYAAGYTAAELEAEAGRLGQTSAMLRLMDFAPPRRGLLKGERLRRYLLDLLGGALDFKDLRFPVALTAVDLARRREVVLDRGPLLEAVLATISVPGIFPPVEMGALQLVDGGILNNVPADVTRRLGAEAVIAVDVIQTMVDAPPERLGAGTQIGRLLPGFAVDFYRAELIMSAAITETRLKQARPDLVLCPDIAPDIDIFFGFAQEAKIIHAGEEAAQKALPAIERLLRPRFRGS